MSETQTIQDILARKQPVTQVVSMVLESDKAQTYNDLKDKRDEIAAKVEADPDNKDAAAQLTKLKEQTDQARADVEAVTVEFKFASIGRDAFEKIMSDNPPTADEKAKAIKAGRPEPLWNQETYPIKLVAACSVDPKMSEEDVQKLWDSPDWNQAEVVSLFFCCQDVNQGRRVVDLKND